MSGPEIKPYHAGKVWEYSDAIGVRHIGHFEGFSDHGGTDVPYFFRDSESGALSVVSGARLKEARAIHGVTGDIKSDDPIRRAVARMDEAREAQ
jgi:hypothetical protein